MSPTSSAQRTALSPVLVADRALALADAEGIEAVTIRRLATDLGVTPMALYWHFRTKEELLAGAADRVLAALDVPEPTGDWAEDLRAALLALLAAMRPHPQLASLIPQRILAHPQGLAITENALAALAAAGFDTERAAYLAMQALRTAISMVTGDAVDDSGTTPEERDAYLRAKRASLSSLSPERYPAVVAHAEAMTYCHDVEAYFALGVEHYVAGVRGLAPGSGRRVRTARREETA